MILPEPETGKNEPVKEIPSAVVDQPVLEEMSADGTVRWTLYLDRITREEGAVMELDQPRALYRLQSGEVLDVTGEFGTYDEEAGVLTLSGGVHGAARQAAFGFVVDRMVWDSVQGLLTASGGVEIDRQGLRFSGEEFVLELGRGFARIEVTGGIEITTAPETLAELE